MTAVVWDIVVPPTEMLPVTVTVKSVETVIVALHDSVDVPGEGGSVTLVNGEQVRPAEGAATSATVPARLFTAVTVITWVPATPLLVVTITGADGAIVKSTTWNVMTAVA
jgi:hypothetical protein